MSNYIKDNDLNELFIRNIPFFQAVGDSMRQKIILELIQHGPLSVNKMAELCELSRPATSHHLKILKAAKILKVEKEGKSRIYYLSALEALEDLKCLIENVELICETMEEQYKD